MSDHLLQTIHEIEAEIKSLESELTENKKLVNRLCIKASLPPRFVIQSETSGGLSLSARPDQYYGRPLATVVKEYLEARKAYGLGSATLDEIYENLKKGGFQFEGEFPKRTLGIAISKNTRTFHKLPNESIGLTIWYEDIKPNNKEQVKDQEPPLIKKDKIETKDDVSVSSVIMKESE